MAIVVSLDRFIDQMDLPHEEWSAYLNRHTGDFVTATEEIPLGLEELEEEDRRTGDGTEDDLADEELEPATGWRAELPEPQALLQSDDFLPLPGKAEIHEWSIMDRFCATIPDQSVQEVLLGAIRGSGAFQFFDEKIRRLGIERNWYRYRRDALETIAVSWLKKHGIDYEQRTEFEEIG